MPPFLRRRRLHQLLGIVAASWLILAPALLARAQAPTLSHVQPHGVQPGQTVDLTLTGSNLAGAGSLWTSFPAKAHLAEGVENNGQQPNQVVFRLEVPADAPLGIHGLRVAAAGGVSNLKLFVVDDLPAVAEVEPNDSPGEPQEIQPPVAVDGIVKNEELDDFRFHAAAGQRLTFEVLARRIGSPLDPVVRLLDLRGRELAYSDDEGGLGSDSRLTYTFREEGDYLLELRDIRYQGGDEYAYRLRIGDLPDVTVPYPMGGKSGTHIAVEFAGDHPTGIPSTEVSVPDEPWRDSTWLAARAKGGNASTFVRFLIGDSREVLEAEPNDLPDQSTWIPVPAAVNGKLGREGDRDGFVFTAKKGERFVFQGITRSQGSPADLLLSLQKADGSQVADADDSGMNEGAIDYAIPEDGDYRLVVEDLLGRGGPKFAYRVEVKPYKPGFSLTATADKLDVPKNGVAVVTVEAARRDYNGPIALKVEGLPEGFTASPSVIGPGQKQASLTLAGSGSLPEAQALAARILGTAQVGDAEVVEQVDVSGPLSQALSNMNWPPRELAGAFAVGAAPEPVFQLRTAREKLTVGRNFSAPLSVTAARTGEFKEAIPLKVEGLPEKITVESKPVPEGTGEVELSVKAAADAPIGTFTGLVSGTAKFQDKDHTQPAPALLVEVTEPAFELSADWGEGKLIQGQKLTLKVGATRKGYDGPITISVENLPEGVTVAEGLVIPKNENAVEIEVSADDDAKVAEAKNVRVTAKAELPGGLQSLTTPDATLNVAQRT